jgi:hypothetical protein
MSQWRISREATCEVLRCLPSQNEALLHRVRSQFFQVAGRRICALRNYYVNNRLAIQPTGIHYLLVMSVNHDSLFSHCNLMEAHHIIKVDSCKQKCNYRASVHVLRNKTSLWVRPRDHGVCVCNQVLSVLLKQAR